MDSKRAWWHAQAEMKVFRIRKAADESFPARDILDLVKQKGHLLRSHLGELSAIELDDSPEIGRLEDVFDASTDKI